MRLVASIAAAAAVLSVARLASAQDAGGMAPGATSGPSWGRPDVQNSPETQGPSPQGKNSVKLFDAYRSQISYQIDVGPIWVRRASETTPITRRRNFDHMAPLASELAFGTMYTTKAFKGPIFIATETLTSFRILDDKSFSWTLFEEKLGGGISIGPLDFEAKIRAHFIHVDIMHAQPSIQLLSPGVEAGFGFHLGRIRLDIKGHTEYLWRWFGPDYYIRGVTIGLRFDVNRPKNPFPGAPPAQ